MGGGFDWVPFYEELAQKLLTFRSKQTELVEMLREGGIKGLVDENPQGNSVDLTEIDPFTFLAVLNKQSHPERARLLAYLKPILGVTAPVPSGFLGIPKADPRQTWLFPYRFERDPQDVPKLWSLYEEVVSGAELREKTFAAVQAIKYAGHAKLTQAIFRAAPARFFPVDGQTMSYLASLRISNKFTTAQEFQSICTLVGKRVPKPLYEQSHHAWLLNRPKQPSAEAEYQNKVLAAAAKKADVKEPAGGVPIPKLKTKGVAAGGFQRNPQIAGAALQLAGFKCELDPSHRTFVSDAKDTPYVEAHHLIPFARQSSFGYSLDVLANIVALCPNCHRLLHHGKKSDKADVLLKLLTRREKGLAEKALKIKGSALVAMYRGALLEEDA